MSKLTFSIWKENALNLTTSNGTFDYEYKNNTDYGSHVQYHIAYKSHWALYLALIGIT